MKKEYVIIAGIIGAILLSGWGSPDSNITGDKKQSINFYGTLTTWENPETVIEVDNISIDNIFKQIPMFLKPSRPKKSKKMTAATTTAHAAKAAKKAAKEAQKAAIAAKKGDIIAAKKVAKASQQAADAAAAAAQAVSIAMPKEKTAERKIYT